MALTNKLTAIADAIRGKTGKTEEMTLDQMPLEIAGILAGGGLPNGISAVSIGEITYSARQSSMNVEHSLGVKPDAIFVYAPDFTFPASEVDILGFFWVGYPYRQNSDTAKESYACASTVSTDYQGFVVNGMPVTVTDTNFEGGRPSTVYFYKPGKTYRWCAVKFAEV